VDTGIENQADDLDMQSLFTATIDGIRMITDVSELLLFKRVYYEKNHHRS
jgi:hypothetical protein